MAVEKAEKKVEEKYWKDKKITVRNLIKLGTLKDKEIANITGTSIEFVQNVRAEMK